MITNQIFRACRQERHETIKLTNLLACALISAAGGSNLWLSAQPASALASVGTAFTYQGRLVRAGIPVTDTCDFQFDLWDALAGGVAVGSPQAGAIPVADGRFSTVLDFGVDAFTGSARWLEIAVQCPGDVGFTVLAPRVELTPAPYALALPGLYTQEDPISPNIIGGYGGNIVEPGVYGATIAGGGRTDDGSGAPDYNWVTNHYGTIGGGKGNQTGTFSTVGGGENNTASFAYSTVGGGSTNGAIGLRSTIGGGGGNSASGQYCTIGGGETNAASIGFSTVGGGSGNSASSIYSTVGGGQSNIASGPHSTVGGGINNLAFGPYSVVPGGDDCEANGSYSFAAGRRAKALHEGAFVWSDWTDLDFSSTAQSQFLIRATGGVGIGTSTPTEQLEVSGNVKASGTIQSGNSITIDGSNEMINASDDLEVRIAGDRVLRLEGEVFDGQYLAPNILAGSDANSITPGALGVTVAGGGADTFGNSVTDSFGTVGGGLDNQAGDGDGTVDAYDAGFATVGGGLENLALGFGATVGGGLGNNANGTFATIGGGGGNGADGMSATIGGGGDNITNNSYATIAGGRFNFASASFSIVGGGESNTASGDRSTVSGGYSNIASGDRSTISGGDDNTAEASYSSVCGGGNNHTTGTRSTIGGGGGNITTGVYSVVPGGNGCAAGGDYSFAAGRRAHVRSVDLGDAATDNGTFVWADSTNSDFNSDGGNRFLVRASGGSTIYSNPATTTGVSLAAGGGSWSSVSDRALKENIKPVDGREVLERLASVPLAEWNYKSQSPDIRHMGPMGQDFHVAFGLGEEQTRISTIDADGVALAAIQGLHQLVQEQDCQITELLERNEQLRRSNAEHLDRSLQLEDRVARLEAFYGFAVLTAEPPREDPQ